MTDAALSQAIRLDRLMRTVRDAADDLANAVLIALGTDRRATDDDVLPTSDDNRRGWWADTDASAVWGGWPIGSRFWLMARAKITGPGSRAGSALAVAEGYGREALQPFITARIASRVDVTATRSAPDRIDVVATLYRGDRALITLRYQDLWSAIIA